MANSSLPLNAMLVSSYRHTGSWLPGRSAWLARGAVLVGLLMAVLSQGAMAMPATPSAASAPPAPQGPKVPAPPKPPALPSAGLDRNFKGVRVAWFKDLGGVPFDARVRTVVDGHRKTFESLGWPSSE